MFDVLVFNAGKCLGIVNVPEPGNNEIICLYKKWNLKEDNMINILYFKDMHYGTVISDEAAEYFDELEEQNNK